MTDRQIETLKLVKSLGKASHRDLVDKSGINLDRTCLDWGHLQRLHSRGLISKIRDSSVRSNKSKVFYTITEQGIDAIKFGAKR